MKKALFIAIACILHAACTKVQEQTPILTDKNGEQVTVSISFSPYSLEPITKANVSISETSKRLDVFIVDGETITDLHQNKEEQAEGFGSISATLNKTKTYLIYAVAHKGSGEASLADNIITFADNKVTDTFFYSTSFTPSENVNLSCVMHRIVGRFKLTMTDPLPSELEKVLFTVSGSGLGYNVNGFSTNIGDKPTMISNPSSANDGSTTFNIYCLADEATSQIDVTVTALDADEGVIETMTFEDVPIRAGYSTAYRGTFFVTQGATMTFTAPDAWNNFDDATF